MQSRIGTYKRIFTLTAKSSLILYDLFVCKEPRSCSKKNLTIAEVVYEGGFNNPKYFSKFFKTEFNLSPSVFQAEKKKQLKEVESD